MPFATDACHAVSKRSVKIIVWDSLGVGQNVANQSSDSRAAHAQKALVSIAEK